MSSTKNIFAIYAGQDKDVLQYLLLHLQPLEKDFNLNIWSDDTIYTGQPWKPKNASRIERADIFLLLVSDAFMHSEFIKQDEFKMVIDRYKEGKSTVIPILVDDCPWDIDFNSDDYDFNLRELQVFPEDRKPISDWNSTDEAFKQVADYVRGLINLSTEDNAPKKPNKNLGKKKANTAYQDQLAMNFIGDGEADNEVDKEKKLQEKIKTKKRVEKEKIRKGAAEAKKAAQEEQRLKEEAETKRRADQERRLKEEADAKIIAFEEEKKRAEEVRDKRRAEQETKLKRTNQAEKKAAKNNGAEEDDAVYANWSDSAVEETAQRETNPKKRRLLTGLLIAAFFIAGIWAFSVFTTDAEKKSTTLPESEAVEVDSDAAAETEFDSENDKTSFSNLAVGDTHGGGIVFTIDPSNKTGKIAYLKDAGPMPWKNAMNIQEQLGEGWRLPTLNELQLMYQTIGQGATNNGQFANELYWSATPFDENQARLLRFSDGNTSYHYNSTGTHRKFRVRAVQDF